MGAQAGTGFDRDGSSGLRGKAPSRIWRCCDLTQGRDMICKDVAHRASAGIDQPCLGERGKGPPAMRAIAVGGDDEMGIVPDGFACVAQVADAPSLGIDQRVR